MFEAWARGGGWPEGSRRWGFYGRDLASWGDCSTGPNYLYFSVWEGNRPEHRFQGRAAVPMEVWARPKPDYVMLTLAPDWPDGEGRVYAVWTDERRWSSPAEPVPSEEPV